MKKRSLTRFLSMLGGTILLMPLASQAANVGYMEMCGDNNSATRHAAAITAAGHTPVQVTTPNAAALQGLAALSVTNCSNGDYSSTYTANLAAIQAAVQSGMVLVIHDRYVSGAASILPGGSGVDARRNFGNNADRNIDFPAGSRIITGPGGTLTNASLDGGSSSSHGYVIAATLPTGGTVLAIRPTNGEDDDESGNGFVSCAAEGYTGTQLNWCRQICEIEQTPANLNSWIHRWINRYRVDPPCLAEGGGGSHTGTPQAMEGATVQYPFGNGRVIYSTIPLDFYMASGGIPAMYNVYLPNVLGWAVPTMTLPP